MHQQASNIVVCTAVAFIVALTPVCEVDPSAVLGIAIVL